MDLQTYRKAHQLSQARLAELLTGKGIRANQSNVSQWERGRANGGYDLPTHKAKRIAAALPGITLAGLRPDVWGKETHGRRRDAA